MLYISRGISISATSSSASAPIFRPYGTLNLHGHRCRYPQSSQIRASSPYSKSFGSVHLLHRPHRFTPTGRPSSSPWSNQHIHTSPTTSSWFSRWLNRGRGMRRTIGAWADSLGITGHAQANRTRELRAAGGDMKEGEELFVMPGWAVVKYREEEGGGESTSPAPFDIHVSVSGYCAEARSPSKSSRTQRVLISVVRRFAALPNLPGLNPEDLPLGPLPAAVGMAFVEQAGQESDEEAERRKNRNHAHADRNHGTPQSRPQPQPYVPYVSRRKRTNPPISPITHLDSTTHPTPPSLLPCSTKPDSSDATAIDPPSRPSRPSSTRTVSRQSSVTSVDAFTSHDEIRSAHVNLNTRLAPFWSSVLPNRRVLFDIYASPPTPSREPGNDDETADKTAPAEDPLHSFEFYTDGKGHFSQVIVIPWEKLCTTPSTVSAVYNSASTSGSKPAEGDVPLLNWNLRIRSRLDYEELPVEESDLGYRERIRRALSSYGVDAVDPALAPQAQASGLSSSTPAQASAPSSSTTRTGDNAIPSVEKLSLNTPGEPQVIEWTTIRVGRPGGIHIISDVDDTVKHSDILAGPREVFRNVFCRPLEDICVPEMDAMYRRMDGRGVSGFHFVSNSPSQLFPSIRRFLTVNSFPPRHSIKLKYYGGRSIFASLYDSPAERKRASLAELFRAFPTATFAMFGDSAEQDLELYMEFANKFPGRVAMVAIRDVTSDRAAEVWREVDRLDKSDEASTSTSDSLVASALVQGPTDILPPHPHVPGEMPTRAPLRRTDSSASASTAISDEELRTLSSSQQKILQSALTWRSRMDTAERDRPEGTILRFYRDPGEVEGELERIVDKAK